MASNPQLPNVQSKAAGPTSRRGIDWTIAFALSGISFGLYGYTAAPDIGLVDSSELALAAYTGGVAHPPGFPLYILLGRVVSHLAFLGSPARALNLMSAWFAALSVGACFLATRRLIDLVDPAPRDEADKECERRTDWIKVVAALAAALAWMTARVPWSWSSVAEVYSLNVFLLAASWFCAFEWACRQPPRSPGTPKSRRAPNLPREIPMVRSVGWLMASIALASLGLANHHATAALAFVVVVPLGLIVYPRILREPRLVALASIFGVLPFALYLYLPFATARDPGLRWGNVTDLSSLVDHVGGRQYRVYMSEDLSTTVSLIGQFLGSMVRDVGLAASALSAAGVLLGIVVGIRRFPSELGLRTLAVSLPLGVVAMNLLLVVMYSVGPEDRTSYYLPAHLAWSVTAGSGWWLLGKRFKTARNPIVGGAMLALMVVPNVWRNFDYCNLRHERTARLLVEETIGDVPERSVVFTANWSLYAPFLYMRQVEGYRPGLRVVDALMMSRVWYLGYVEREMPELVLGSGGEFEAYREQLELFDRGETYDRAEIARSYDALMIRWAELGRADGGAFADFTLLDHERERGWMTKIESVPRGMLVELLPSDTATEPMTSKDRENLEYLHERIHPGGESEPLPPEAFMTHLRYWKVHRAYRQAVEASLLVVAMAEGEGAMRDRAEDYRPWFPDVDAAAQEVGKRLAASGRPRR